LLLQPATRSGTYSLLLLLALRLKHSGSEQSNLFAFLHTVQNFSVIEIADAHAH
jgi:hypothetical protein